MRNIDRWCFSEFRHVDFRDERLFSRFLIAAQALSAHPERSIHHACGSWASAKAAYRMFDNPKIREEEILLSHQIETSRRALRSKLLLAIQDTTFLDFESHPKTTGLGSIGKAYGVKDKPGLILHPTLLMTEHGMPLGLASLQCWTRNPHPKYSKEEKRSKQYRAGLFEKESSKWIVGCRECRQLIDPKTRIITITDREGDIFELMAECYKNQDGFVIRSRLNRRSGIDPCSNKKIWNELVTQPVRTTLVVDVRGGNKRVERNAVCEIRFANFSTPMNRGLRWRSDQYHVAELPDTISFAAISVKEICSPGGAGLDWILLTSETLDTVEQALEIIRWYKMRWQIELYFRIIKSGCAIEACRLNKVESLKKYITLMSIVGYRLFAIERLAREKPRACCTELLSTIEWQTLYRRINRVPSCPQDPPSIEEAVYLIARLGGHLGRARDGPPGAMVLWRGWDQLQQLVEFQEILAAPPAEIARHVGNSQH